MTSMTMLNPIVGDPNPTPIYKVDQKTASELQDALNELFSNEVYAIAWSQYTPYFNDGDTCVFGVNVGSHVLLTSKIPEDSEHLDTDEVEELLTRMMHGGLYGETYEDEDDYLDVSSSAATSFNYETREYENTGLTDPPAWFAAQGLLADLHTGAYNDVLLENFGDHVTVIATPNEFIVRFYEHD